MCGICGVVSFVGEPVSVEALTRACDLLRHRGPDYSGQWLDPRSGEAVGLAATRLAILDLSPAGNQPMHHPSGRYHLVHNGEVYNFRELRRELVALGETFATDSDTEVILAACARWDTDALNRFNGMWALCFYDSQTRSGFLARDRFGIKPLVYSSQSNRLTFASELNALRTLQSSPSETDPFAVRHHLQFGYIPHPHTILLRVLRLQPGHFLRFGPNALSEPVRYYDPVGRATAHTDGRVEESTTALKRRLAEAVAIQRVSDVPIGAFLSGGLDSSIVVRHLAEVTSQPIKTFCVGFEGHRSFDERQFARLVAQRFGTDHYEIVLSNQDALDAIPQVLDHLGEPFGDASIVPTSMLSAFARRHVTVALSGDGGDELFAGYWRYTAHRTLQSYQRTPRTLRRLFEPALAGLSSSKAGAVANRVRQVRKLLRTDSGDAMVRHLAWSRILSPNAEAIFCAPGESLRLDQSVLATGESLVAGMPTGDPLNRILGFDLQYQLPADMLHKVDMASMIHSLEVRVPFLDYHVVEAALALPSDRKLRQGQRKRILIDSYRGDLPDEVLDRGKQGFELPFGEYLRGPLQPLFRDVVTRAAVEQFDGLSFAGVNQVLEDHLARREDHTDLLFALLSLCWWAKRRT